MSTEDENHGDGAIEEVRSAQPVGMSAEERSLAIARSTLIVASVINGILTVASIAMAILTYYLFAASSRQVEEAAKANQFAQEQLRLSRIYTENSVQQSRAFVVVDRIVVAGLGKAINISLDITVKNVGQSPARDVSISAEAAAYHGVKIPQGEHKKSCAINKSDEPDFEGYKSHLTIAPGQSVQVHINSAAAKDKLIMRADAILRGTKYPREFIVDSLLVFGSICYRDINDNMRPTEFCRIYDPATGEDGTVCAYGDYVE